MSSPTFADSRVIDKWLQKGLENSSDGLFIWSPVADPQSFDT